NLARPFDARTFTNDHGKTLNYRLLKPLHYDPSKKYPLVVCLHGSSGRGTDNVKQVSRSLIAQLLASGTNQTAHPAFVFVPQCPPYMDWGGITRIKAVDALVLEGISELEKEFPIDENRRYITGTSMGGFGVWHFISIQPHLFAAAIPISGAGDPLQAQQLTDIPLWAFHGANDRNVLVRGSRDMIEAIKTEGGDPLYTEFSGKAHQISQEVMRTPDLLDWLFAQERAQD
ncbi:MAG: prolyl oligopeptidase family serine peptidase, partial [Bacteroidota bacterium]